MFLCIVLYFLKVRDSRIADLKVYIAPLRGPKDDAKHNGCFFHGTNFSASGNFCVCLKDWFGKSCSVPQAVWMTPIFQKWYSRGQIRIRSRPRTVISSLTINHELDLLEIRVRELNDAVDFFLVCESNYTFFGDPKPLYLQSNLSAGFLSEYQHKIVRMTIATNYGKEPDIWAPEGNSREFLWKQGRHLFKDLRKDDLFMLNDADEIPSREVMLFLKHHDGYGEPVGFAFRWFLYGFFWENDRPTVLKALCTVAYLGEVYDNDSHLVRHNGIMYPRPRLNGTGTVASDWIVTGAQPRYAGWHCSWCFTVPGIQVKLASATRDDGVRWGDIAEKYSAEYIQRLRTTGKYFDGSGPLLQVDGQAAAPEFVKADSKRWQHLLHA